MRGDPNRICECPDPVVRRYQGRLSGPLLERMDLHVSVPVAPWREIQQGPGESTAAVRERVLAARDLQRVRHLKHSFTMNAELPAADLDRYCAPDTRATSLLERAVDRLHLSVRSYARTLRVARTIADLGGQDRIDSNAVAEALGFRRTERE